MRLTVLAAAALAAGAAQAAEPAFLFDALRVPKYRMAWDKLMKDLEPKPNWMIGFVSRLEGAAGEMKPITIDGKPFLLSYVCKPEDCEGHKFEVLFDAGASRAWGALGGKIEEPAFFGKPDAAQQDALAKALRPAATTQLKSE
jgi:hypothetical protein